MSSHTKVSYSDLRSGAGVTEKDVQVLEVTVDNVKVVDIVNASGNLREYIECMRLF